MTLISISCGRSRKARKARTPLALMPGDKVMRKSDRGVRLTIGEVKWVSGDRARIEWPASWRIGGGTLHSTVNLTSPDLMIATPLAIEERRVSVRLTKVLTRIRDAHATPGEGWLVRNRTTEQEWFEECCDELRKEVRSLVAGVRALRKEEGAE